MSTNHDEQVSASGTSALEAGARIGRYLILERIGNGGMGVVYSAYDPELDRRIALKLLDGDKGEQEPNGPARILREAKAMARLAHPNVVAVHDVGVFEGRVFLAMEFLAGGTVKTWLAAGPRSWREVLRVFVAAGNGLVAAHAAGLVHRDFKPENVLLDTEGRPRVVDFGLAREAALPEGHKAAAPQQVANEAASSNPLETITRTGTILGTPAYMAPEQFFSEPVDARTDQFSFCVALYEALYGQRPFLGENAFQLLRSMMEGRFRPVPDDTKVPTWIRRVLLRGLTGDRAMRWPSMAELIAALEDDPVTRRRRRVVAGAALTLALASALTAGQLLRQHHVELERRIALHLDEAERSADSGRALAAALRDLRSRAFAAFDDFDRTAGEALWKQALAKAPAVDAAYDRAERAYESAQVLDPSRSALRAKLADLLAEHIRLAEELRDPERARALRAALDRYDDEGTRRAALDAPGALTMRAHPASANVTLERYELDAASGRRVPRAVALPVGAGALVSLRPGSYRVTARAPGFADVVYPLELARGELRQVDIEPPPAAVVPAGFVYVPAGELWFGDGDEELRTQFLDTTPMHRRVSNSFLIARHEVTFRDWIAFLDALPASGRGRLLPDAASGTTGGALRLREDADGWRLVFHPMFRPNLQPYTARAGEPIVYAGRKVLARQDWLSLPVSGISAEDANQYLAWLRETNRVPGARLCTELEWERAARGADGRLYPHGDQLAPEDANFDLTYGRVAPAFGPDAVGAHPGSTSPFGIDDLAGNVWELVTSSLERDGYLIRGGAYYLGTASCRSTNREVVPASLRSMSIGFRVCASLAERAH